MIFLYPMTGDISAWHAPGGIAALVTLAALAIFGFSTSLAGRPVLSEIALEE